MEVLALWHSPFPPFPPSSSLPPPTAAPPPSRPTRHKTLKPGTSLSSVFQQADAKHGRLTFRDFVAWQRRMTPEDATLGVVKDEEKMVRFLGFSVYK
jgi:hypothetical protein